MNSWGHYVHVTGMHRPEARHSADVRHEVYEQACPATNRCCEECIQGSSAPEDTWSSLPRQSVVYLPSKYTSTWLFLRFQKSGPLSEFCMSIQHDFFPCQSVVHFFMLATLLGVKYLHKIRHYSLVLGRYTEKSYIGERSFWRWNNESLKLHCRLYFSNRDSIYILTYCRKF